jgi:hypothetical protein
MAQGISRGMGYTDVQRFRLATVFAGVTLIALGFSVVFWHLIGAL